MKLAAGEFDKRVTIELPVTTNNALHEPVQTGTQTIGKRWANVVPLTGREFQLAQQTQADITHRVEFRSDALTRGLTTQHQLRYCGRVLNITRVFDEDEARRKVVAECKETV